ncbi:arginine repressor, C-terminal domain protein [Ligilactobacillus hayakitensis DSM 18933 = JCM 14209]|uniref:Arginine repressor n=1 Tax=Ligilactobacillus hayakitensis DSM 18933 = JCM 14209 TaxID=1423755 RepID=A0A0R1WRY6_9LACO|nr:arginine repressor, C-terminal domain protein [Ligilactobacillus hayakitensis DSM 18933 = JCM 14209]
MKVGKNRSKNVFGGIFLDQRQRRAMIAKIFDENTITTQDQILKILNELGVNVTQATISRDMKALNIVKMSTDDGKTVYKQLKVQTKKNYEKLYSEIYENVLGLQTIQFINLIKTSANLGYANILAARLDDLEIPEIAGTLAGNDTIVVFSKNNEDAKYVYDLIYEHMDDSLK